MAVWIAWLLGGMLAAGGLAVALWALFRDRARGRLRCPKCWYDMSGAVRSAPKSVRCPECGLGIDRPQSLRRTHRRWRWALVGCGATMVGLGWPTYLTLRQPGAGWWTFTPAPILYWIVSSQPSPSGRATDHLRYGVLPNHFRPGWTTDWMNARALRLLREGTAGQRAFAAGALGCMAAPTFASGGLITALDDPSPVVRERALWALKMLRADPDRAISKALALAGDKAQPPGVRVWAFDLVCESGRTSAAAVAAATASLDDADTTVQGAAAGALGRASDDANAVVPKLLAVLIDTNRAASVRASAAQALGRFGAAATPAVPILVAGSTSGELGPDPSIPVRVLGQIGPPAASALPHLTAIVGSSVVSTREMVEARAAVLVISGKQPNMVSALVALFADPDPAIRGQAAWAICYLQEPALGGAIPAAIVLLDDADADVRRYAALTLSQAGIAASAALPRLRALERSDPDPAVRGMAGYSVKCIERRAQLGY